MKVVCIAGPRPGKIGINDNDPIAVRIINRLYSEIEKAILSGAEVFITGGAPGVDQWSAEIVILLKRVYPYIKLYIARPFPSQDALWDSYQKEHYKKLLSQVDKVIDVNLDPAAKWKYFARNKWMIGESDGLIVVWDGSDGGTSDTIKHANKKGILIIKLNFTQDLIYDPDIMN